MNKNNLIASDTDSLYVLAEDLLLHRFPNLDLNNDDAVIPKIRDIAQEFSNSLNEWYKDFTKVHFNTENNRLDMKSETIGKKIYISEKKQYAQLIVEKEGVRMEGDDMFDMKGLEFLKSSMSKIYKDFGKEIIKDILFDKSKSYIDSKILNFKEKYKNLPLDDILKPVSLNKYSEYIERKPRGGDIFSTIKPHCPINTKAAIIYNDLLRFKEKNEYPELQPGDKMTWCYLKDNNPYNIEVIGIHKYNPIPELLEYANKYINKSKMIEVGLVNKLQKIYDNMQWGPINFNKNVNKFLKFI